MSFSRLVVVAVIVVLGGCFASSERQRVDELAQTVERLESVKYAVEAGASFDDYRDKLVELSPAMGEYLRSKGYAYAGLGEMLADSLNTERVEGLEMEVAIAWYYMLEAREHWQNSLSSRGLWRSSNELMRDGSLDIAFALTKSVRLQVDSLAAKL